MIRTKEQNKELHLLLNRTGLDSDNKAELVRTYTKGRTSSSAEMLIHECRQLIGDLRVNNSLADNKRKRVISHLKEAGFSLPDGRADMERIQGWVQQQKFKRKLNEHTIEQLSGLIHAANAVRKHFLSKVR